MNSIDYYDQNGQAFFQRTVKADVSESYGRFLPLLKPGARILDAGCGSGRDALYFAGQGFDVVAFDGSLEMVRISSELLGKQTLHLLFRDQSFDAEFDGVWASASLLHVAYEEMRSAFEKLHKGLKDGGILFATFKYGQGAREVEGRTFYDMDEKSIVPYIEGLFTIIDIWPSADTRSTVGPAPSRAWLNLLCKKAYRE
jgi:SAM-dependent methyltransferase